MRVAVVALLAALLAACRTVTVYVQEPPKDDRAFVDDLRGRTAQIHVQCDDGRYSGTTVLLRSTMAEGALYATAAHVATPGCALSVGTTALELLAWDEDGDWAVLRGPPVGVTSVPPLELSPYYLGMPVVVVGYPRQHATERTGLQVTRGHLVAEYPRRLRISASFYMGSSGGPVFDEHGRLLGLSVSVRVLMNYPLVDEFYVTSAEGFAEYVSPIH